MSDHGQLQISFQRPDKGEDSAQYLNYTLFRKDISISHIPSLMFLLLSVATFITGADFWFLSFTTISDRLVRSCLFA